MEKANLNYDTYRETRGRKRITGRQGDKEAGRHATGSKKLVKSKDRERQESGRRMTRRRVTGRQEDKETGRHGDSETGRQADRQTGRQGDRETMSQGDKETRRQGNRETCYRETVRQ